MPMSRLAAETRVMSLPPTVIAAGVGVLQAREQPQRGGLAAAGRAEQRDQLAGLQGQVQVVERDHRAVVPAQSLQPHLDGGPGRAVLRSGYW